MSKEQAAQAALRLGGLLATSALLRRARIELRLVGAERAADKVGVVLLDVEQEIRAARKEEAA